ncbi:hypothetical protein [Micromonospora sp. KC606]|nr:hypothetical protein [Micromonospora sp. KC606]
MLEDLDERHSVGIDAVLLGQAHDDAGQAVMHDQMPAELRPIGR